MKATADRLSQGKNGEKRTTSETMLALRKENEQLKLSKATLEQQVASINNALRQWALEAKP